MAVFLHALSRRDLPRDESAYPFCVPVIRNLDTLRFSAPVTIIAGDNGSGKTTLMEILASCLNAVHIDGEDGTKAEKRSLMRSCSRAFSASLLPRPRRCFYFQAEDFIRYTDRLQRMRDEAQQELAALNTSFSSRSDYARSLAAMPHLHTLHDLDTQYAHDLRRRSHGEGFLDFFAARLQPDGLYLLDEPEGALSYTSQMAMLSMMLQAVREGSQFILATHSPVLCACPGAALWQLREEEIIPTTYEGLDSVQFLHRLMHSRESVMRLFGVTKDENEEE